MKFSDISDDKVLQLDGMDWAYFVLYNRGRLEKIKGTSFYEKYEGMGKNKDFVVGPIADDNMSRVINKFVNDEITDKALLKSISSIDYGIQYVAKTEYACSKIECVYEEELSPEVTIPLILENAKRRQAGLDAASDMLYEYRRKGRYFSEVLQKHINKNVTHKLFSR